MSTLQGHVKLQFHAWKPSAPLKIPTMCRLCEGMRRVSPIRLASIIERTRHNCAAANGAIWPLQLHHEGITTDGQVVAQRSPADTLCPTARGLSPQHTMGASSPSVRCEVVFPLPSKMHAGGKVHNSEFVNLRNRAWKPSTPLKTTNDLSTMRVHGESEPHSVGVHHPTSTA